MKGPKTEVFVPSWTVESTGDELRAPKLRQGGLAVTESPPAPATPVPALETPARHSRQDTDRASIAGDASPAEAPRPEATRARHADSSFAAPPRPGMSAATSAPERSRSSVLVACLIGAAIAAGIVTLAFAFRPAPPAETTPATTAGPESAAPEAP